MREDSDDVLSHVGVGSTEKLVNIQTKRRKFCFCVDLFFLTKKGVGNLTILVIFWLNKKSLEYPKY